MSKDRNPDERAQVTTTGVKLRKEAETWSDAATVELVDKALVVVSQAYDQDGNALITEGNATFAGYPGVRLLVRAGGEECEVTLSPIHGHQERRGGDGIPEGTQCEVCSPYTGKELPQHGPQAKNGTFRMIYLTPDCTDAHVVVVSDIWGDHNSRIVDEFEVLSEYVGEE
jgi:hypothetical protein